MKTKPFKAVTLIGAWFGYFAPLLALAQQPIITIQPTNRFLSTSYSFYFFVGATGAEPLSYQWLFNGAAIAGATRSSLVVTAPKPAQWGFYSVIVSNLSGCVTSRLAELKVFTAARHSFSAIQVQVDGSVNL